jgi:hypothetical protein
LPLLHRPLHLRTLAANYIQEGVWLFSPCAALGKGVSVEPFRRERLELTGEKTAYRKHADDAVLEVRWVGTHV